MSISIINDCFEIDKDKGELIRYHEDKSQSDKVIIPDSVRIIGRKAFESCKSITFYRISDPGCVPETNCYVKLSNGEIIKKEEFENSKRIESVKIPSSVSTIDYYAFSNCENLKTVVFAEGVKYIMDNAFEGCASLESVTIPSSVEEIGFNAFRGCNKLREVTIKEGCKVICSGAFCGCESLEIVDLPKDSVEFIGDRAFERSKLKRISISKNCISIGKGAFH